MVKSTRSWDIFCKVIDNYGDIGVCWRLAVDLAARGHAVRLWVDDASALRWMAPCASSSAGAEVRVMHWSQSAEPMVLVDLAPADVWIEGFGCDLEPAFVAHRFAIAANCSATLPKPVWINLEYLSAELYATRSHGLPSPILQGPAKGHTRWFFYPGFTVSTGGLIREPGLARRRSAFDRAAWISSQGMDWAGEQLVSLFCYEPAALPELLAHYQHGPAPTLLLVTHGRATAAVKRLLGLAVVTRNEPTRHQRGALSVVFLPSLTQREFDHLLWACDMNFVRGEDSLVRALWAARPFVWQIYPQDDGAHQAKLHAFLGAVQAPASWRLFHQVWNSLGSEPLPAPEPGLWAGAVQRAQRNLAGQSDLSTRLLQFVEKVSGCGKTGLKGR